MSSTDWTLDNLSHKFVLVKVWDQVLAGSDNDPNKHPVKSQELTAYRFFDTHYKKGW